MITHMLTGMLLSTLLYTGIPTTPTISTLQISSEVHAEGSYYNGNVIQVSKVLYEVSNINSSDTSAKSESMQTSSQTVSEKETESITSKTTTSKTETKSTSTKSTSKETSTSTTKKDTSESDSESSGSKERYVFGRNRKKQDLPEITSKVVNKTITYSYVPAEDTDDIENSETYKYVQSTCIWEGSVIDHSGGINKGPNGDETYYNLEMSGVVDIMRKMGNTDPYWVRSDGVHMIGNYVMIASDLSLRPRGTIYETSRGMSMVCDTGSFAEDNPMQTDIAVTW